MKRRDFMMGVGAAIGLTIIEASSAESTVHRPRLLINKTDPFTGLALLKTRYQMGMRFASRVGLHVVDIIESAAQYRLRVVLLRTERFLVANGGTAGS